MKVSDSHFAGMEYLIEVSQELSRVRTLSGVVEIVRHAARKLTGADGATFILRDGGFCSYVDEDAIGPLWKGRRFPLEMCISGWSMLHRQAVVIEDIYQDDRIPHEAYRPTFVKSLLMVPIRHEDPVGAIGNYWAQTKVLEPYEIRLLESLAHATAIALENVRLNTQLQDSLDKCQKTLAELERQLHLRDEFISVATHELKTPITPLLLQVQLFRRLLASGRPEAHFQSREMATFLDGSVRQIENLDRLIDNLLDVSRIRLGRFSFDCAPGVDLVQIVNNIVQQFPAPARDLVQIEVEPAGAAICGYWDALKLEQLIRNLLANAFKYGEGKKIQVRLLATPSGAELWVRDQGIGISPENQSRIFERFERAVPAKNYGGMGIGLFIVREVVSGHGGQIVLESTLGKGSTFRIHLPWQAHVG